jgi:hypothetical protein
MCDFWLEIGEINFRSDKRNGISSFWRRRTQAKLLQVVNKCWDSGHGAVHGSTVNGLGQSENRFTGVDCWSELRSPMGERRGVLEA